MGDTNDDRQDPEGDESAAAAPDGTQRHRHHPFRWLALGLGAVVLALGAVVVVTYVVRERPQARSVGDAVDRLRNSGTAQPSGGDGTAPLPEEGVYSAVGQGRESISFPPNSQEDGQVIPATVQHLGDDCFRFRVDANEAHWHQWDLCHRDGALVLTKQRNYQRWDFGSLVVENVGEYECDPPSTWVPAGAATGGADGKVVTGACTGSNSAAPGPATSSERTRVVGVPSLRIGGERVRTVHIRQEARLGGPQTGLNKVDLWLDATTGMPLRFERDYTVNTDSPMGTITYREEGEWQIQSMTPRR